jgi:hypothetical protein
MGFFGPRRPGTAVLVPPSWYYRYRRPGTPYFAKDRRGGCHPRSMRSVLNFRAGRRWSLGLEKVGCTRGPGAPFPAVTFLRRAQPAQPSYSMAPWRLQEEIQAFDFCMPRRIATWP